MKSIILKFSFLIVVVFSIFICSCHKDKIFEGEEIELRFSLDTLRFDTVFTEVGTITRLIKIYNNQEEAVILDNINIKNGESSFFRMNVDGLSAKSEIKDIRIEAADSIYVFVEATIDPDNPLSISPFIIEDQLNIVANSSEYIVYLEAFGQNANYFPDRFSKSQVTIVTCTNPLIWNDPKPYVIYGAVAFDNCELIIEPGTRIYVHGGVAINDLGVYNDGLIIIPENSTIKANGTVEDPIYIRSDRLEEEFLDEQGQWAGLIIQANSRGNILEHTIIQHSIVGISVDSAANVNLNACQFGFTSGSGLSASHANITATNCLFYQNATNGISLGYGGTYNFNHCTVANYDNQGAALSLSNAICSDPLCLEEIFVFPLNATFNNCIFSGNEADEISLLDFTDGDPANFFNYQLNHCIVTVDELIEPDAYPNFFDNCLNCENIDRSDTLYLDLENYDHHLDTLSLAIDKGSFLPFVLFDIEGNQRETDAVDIGCYEFQK